MKLDLVDRITLDANDIRITSDGYLVANPRVARTGIQLYRGSEVGMKDKAIVRVYRPEEEVFNKDSLHSMAHRPVTNDHPPVAVTADNWKDYAVGQTGGDVARDGDFVRVPMCVMDSKTIKDIQSGKNQLSQGYSCELVFGDGVTPSGEKYDAKMTNIRGNHSAIVKFARGGDRLALGDSAPPLTMVFPEAFGKAVRMIGDGKVVREGEPAKDTKPEQLAPGYAMGDGAQIFVSSLEASKKEAQDSGDEAVVTAIDSLLALLVEDGSKERTQSMPKTILVDGVSVTFDSDQSAQIVQRALDAAATTLKQAQDSHAAEIKRLNDAASTSAATITTLTADSDKLKAQVETLTKQVEDSKMTPAKLDQLVADRAVVTGKAKAVLGDKLVVDGKTDAEIRRQVVDAKLGDKAKGWSDDQITVSFDTLTADVKADQSPATRDARNAFASQGHYSNDSADKRDAALDKRDAALSDAWKTPTAA